MLNFLLGVKPTIVTPTGPGPKGKILALFLFILIVIKNIYVFGVSKGRGWVVFACIARSVDVVENCLLVQMS